MEQLRKWHTILIYLLFGGLIETCSGSTSSLYGDFITRPTAVAGWWWMSNTQFWWASKELHSSAKLIPVRKWNQLCKQMRIIGRFVIRSLNAITIGVVAKVSFGGSHWQIDVLHPETRCLSFLGRLRRVEMNEGRTELYTRILLPFFLFKLIAADQNFTSTPTISPSTISE